MDVLIEQGNPYAAGAPEVLRLEWEDFRFSVSQANRAVLGRKAKWTVLVYLAADCDLARWMFDDLLELKSVASSSDVNVLVFFDGPLLCDSFMARLNPHTPLGDDLVARFVELNMADPATLTLALRLAEAYPAERRLTVLAGHGGGWRGGLLDQALGMRLAREPGRVLLPAPYEQCESELRDCQRAAQDLVSAATTRQVVGKGRPLDVLAFDACYMGNLEAVATLAERANWLVLSEDQWPGEGFDYRALLGMLNADPDLAPEALVRAWVSHSARTYRTSTARGAPVTLAALEAARLPPLADAFVALAQSLDPRDASLMQALDAALADTWRSLPTGLADLKGLAQNLIVRPVPQPCADAAHRLVRCFDEAVVAFCGDGTPAGTNGLSVYAPPPDRFDTDYLRNANTLPLGLGVWAWALGGCYLHLLGDDASAHPLISSLQATMRAAIQAGDWRPA